MAVAGKPTLEVSAAEATSLFDVGASAPAPGAKAELSALIKKFFAQDDLVRNLEEDLKAAKASLQKLRTLTIPDKMAEVGFDSVKLDGKTVTVEPFVSGSLPSDPTKKAAAIAWLIENGASDLIKTTVEVEFGKSEHNVALDTAARLRESGLEPDVSEGVHAQTLGAFARERIRNGDPIDTEILGLFTGRVAKVKR